MPRSASGFTLIELLVVIGIIAVLAALLFPVIGKARESGRMAACTAHQRQVMITLDIWSQDHDEMYPPAETVWQDLAPENKLLICPTAGKNLPYSYVYNAYVADQAVGDPRFDGQQSQIISFADATPGKTVARRRQDVALRHRDKAVAAFLDGHVQLVRFDELAIYHVGLLTYKSIPFTSNDRYTATVTPQGTTITCTAGPAVWTDHIMSDLISDVSANTFCRIEFTIPYPDKPLACGFSTEPPYMTHGFTGDTDAIPYDTRISIWERPPFGYVARLNDWRYSATSRYAVERQEEGVVTYIANEKVIYTSATISTEPLQFHYNGYMVGSEVRNLRYCIEEIWE